MKTLHVLLGAMLTIAATAVPVTSNAAGGPIAIQQCFVTVPKHFSRNASGTQIVYVNEGRRTATKVTFAVGYRNAEGHYLRKISDVGSFAPGATINHHFALYNDLTYGGKQTTVCRAIAVTWADGRRWTAP